MTSIGQVYLYTWNETLCLWEETDVIRAELAIDVTDIQSGAYFGHAVSISGNKIAISASGYDYDGNNSSGIVYIYTVLPDGTAEFSERLLPYNNDGSDDHEAIAYFGQSLELTGNNLIVGAIYEDEDALGGSSINNAGAAYIYQFDGTSFGFEAKLVAPARYFNDSFGSAVSIFADKAVVGADSEDEDETDDLASTLESAGSAYIYKKIAGTWTFTQKITAPVRAEFDRFGRSLDLTQGYIVVGAWQEDENALEAATISNAGSAYTFYYDGTNFNYEQKLTALNRGVNDYYGLDVSISNDMILIGARGHNLDELEASDINNAGATFLYNRSGPPSAPWAQIQKFAAFDRDELDHFGYGAMISNDKIIISAPSEDHIEDGGDPATGQAGSCYIYHVEQLPTISSITPSLNPICSNIPVTLTVEGILNDAIDWHWYEGSCDGPEIGTGESITVSPSLTTTYCVRGEGCFDPTTAPCACIDIEVKDGHWHQSTTSGLRDEGNAIITDINGNVYITGSYYGSTHFPGGDHSPVSLDDMAPSGNTMKTYITKYDNCGNLLWVAHTQYVSAGDSNVGNAITLDEANGLVYIAGNFRNDIQFYGGQGDFGGGGTFTTISATGSRGYVATLDMDDGTIKHVTPILLSNYTHLNSITINPTNGHLFIGGTYAVSPPNYRIFVQKYIPTISGIGATIWQINNDTYNQNMWLNDIAYDETFNAIWLIGNFKNTLQLNHGALPVSSTSKDAFIARYTDGVLPTGAVVKQGNIIGEMTGENIAIDDTGNAYLTGTYYGMSSNIFDTGVPLSGMSAETAYFFAVSPSISTYWTTAAHASIGSRGLATTINTDKVYFSGDYITSQTFNDLSTLPYLTACTPTSKRHTFAVAYNITDPTTTLWRNGTTDPLDCNAFHIPNSMTTDHYGNGFIVGTYKHNMGYLIGTPSSGDLPATGQNAYTMRVDLSSPVGSFKSAPLPNDSTTESQTQPIEQDLSVQFKLTPNPVNHEVILNIVNGIVQELYMVTIRSIDGKIVYKNTIQTSETKIDCSSFEAGLYIILLETEGQASIQRFVKQ